MITDQSLLLNALVVCSQNNIVSDMGEEKVILSVENGKYYNLGVMGSQIWNLIQEPKLVTQIVDELMEEFDVDRSTCEDQLLSFLIHLSKEKLVILNRENKGA
ncbi:MULTISPECIES: lasso peptide biosynthesis PqqD family chaperone [unclassified Paenibacillus]|uniref:lasso peptide biosynthesis PqqD family chaperone n=1 Tax=unclassified Paenibacillus TaxID=185978 RepID=UPI002F3E281D